MRRVHSLLAGLVLGVLAISLLWETRRTTKYTGVLVDDAARVVYVDTHWARRTRREAAWRGQRIFGLARECGRRCRVRLRDGQHVYTLHLRRYKVHKSHSTFIPIVQYITSNDTLEARRGRVPLECVYAARADGVREESIVNLCDSEGSIFGLVNLPHGVYSVEPVKNSGNRSRREHALHPRIPRPFDYYEGMSSNESVLWEDLAVRGERSRRAANSWDYHVEVLVVADVEMWRYHGEGLEAYLLTLFSTVASIYRHQSLRASINIVVVKILILKHEHAGPTISPNAQETLRNFCRWQALYNGRNGESLSHHDVAILLTRGDICRSPGKCDTLGLAELGTMCDTEKSCAIIEDNGLSASFTIAHELGHIFNIPHDDERKCAQFMALSKQNFHIMAPTLEYNTHPWSWSACSSALLERFLDSHRGQIQCLFDKPSVRSYYDSLFEAEPPGRKYTVNQQCKFVFGEGAEICPYMPACRRLWCSVTYGNQMGCRTQHMPWADGTPCHGGGGIQQFCHRGECVGMAPEQRTKQDGGWGEWQPWGQCSRTCGGGIQKAARDCDSPRPSNGGKYCTGLRERYRSCSVEECPWDTPPFRDVQCSAFNNKDTGIHGLPANTQWIPKYGVATNERCKLYCRVDGSAAFHLLGDKVVDGTQCDPDSDDLCVDGTCTTAGCDRVLYSTARRDPCGVCGGDGSTCKTVKGRFNERGTFGYNEVMKIPAGSANIDIRQHGYRGQKDDDNYLALRAPDGTFLLNGHYQVSVYRVQIPIQGVILEYSGSDLSIERINGTGPLRSDVYVHVLSVGNLYPPDIHYQYMTTIAPPRTHSWRLSDAYTECSSQCQGTQTRQFSCVDSSGRPANEQECTGRKPSTDTRMCNIDCKFEWHTDDVGQCSVACGSGIQRVRLTCAKVDLSGRSPHQAASPSLCPSPAPSSTKRCYRDCSGRRWSYGEWSACSATCGHNGVSRRTARCIENNRVLDDAYCSREAREEVERDCGRTPCPRWIYGAWSECSRSCDGGVQLRHATCVDVADREVAPSLCPPQRDDRRGCNEQMCTWWRFGTWSECSVSCGVGVHTRNATCVDRNGRQLDYVHCDARERIIQKPCTRRSCPGWRVGEWSACSVSCLDGWQSRRVSCSEGEGLPDSPPEMCGPSPPPSHRPCNQGTCPFWRIGDFGPCSVSCGEGVRMRAVDCVHKEQVVDNSFCSEPVPAKSNNCSVIECAEWNASDWSACSVSCGTGTQGRSVTCFRGKKSVNDLECKTPRPRNVRHCDRPCLAPQTTSISVFWATGPWSDCSTTCGRGEQRRQVICREGDVNVAPARCAELERVESTRSCELRQCAEWKLGEWLPCPVTCGTNVVQSRAVQCMSLSNRVIPDTECHLPSRPDNIRPCAVPSCPFGSPLPGQWKTQPWGECSSTCGGGFRRRNVTCEREMCIGMKPKIFEVCGEDPCPQEQHVWQIAPWTSCSVSCGGGEQRRSVWCEHVESRRKVSDGECEKRKPVEQRDCRLPSCPSAASASARREWTTGPWNACSVRCGKGSRSRMVSCVENDVIVASTLCDQTTKPNTTQPCRGRCARWKVSEWGSCSVSCGVGVRRRLVRCQRGRVHSVPDSECSHLPKPQDISRCPNVQCPAYRWMTTVWSRCSNPCAAEEQHRRVFCLSSIGRRAAPRMCSHTEAPPITRRCSIDRCPYQWIPGPWNTCSQTCGEGRQTRTHECRLRKEHSPSKVEVWVPIDKCAALPAPPAARACHMSSCEAQFRWTVGPWKQCSTTCGEGVRRRRVRCVDAAGAKMKKEMCEKASQPPHVQSCFLKNCLPSTCQEIRAQSNFDDGNYTLLLDGYPIQVYCDRMSHPIPRAYLNVNPSTNYAEIYGKRLMYPITCPHNGKRNDSCQCTGEGHSGAGRTVFSKVRIDLQNRKININDFAFAETTEGVAVPYATAGDCYSMKECPQGRFSVDLRGTGVRIVDDLQWEDRGHRTVSRIDRTHRNQLIDGLCGGFCGRCSPDKYKGLVFEAVRV